MPDTRAVNSVSNTVSTPRDGLRLALLGHPVSQSLSPRIHAAFAAQLGLATDYAAIDVASGELSAALAAFAQSGGKGGNVTVPHKLAALALCSTLSDRATRAGAVNTLIARDGGWHGDNTDGAGLVRDLADRHGLDLRERRTLLLGAGGAARGVAPALLDAGIGELFIVNRDSARGDALSDLLGEPARVHSRYVEDLRELGEFELVINATSAGRGSPALVLPMSLAGARTAAVDLNYGEAAIPFLAWAQAAGVRDAIDGLGMLVEQAAESFALWHGTRPSTDDVFAELRSHDAILASAE